MEQTSRESTITNRTQFSGQAGEEAEVYAVIEGINDAFRAKDLEKIMSFYAEDMVAFDIMPPLEFNGKQAYREAWKMGLDGMREIGPFEDTHRRVFVSGDLAVLHCLCHMTGTLKKDEKKIDMWSRYTGVMRRIEGKWLISHEQISVPIEMESEKPLWNLKPEAGLVH